MIGSLNIKTCVRVLLLILALMPLKTFSQDITVYLFESRALMDAGKYDEAVSKLTDALKEKQDGRIYKMRAEVLMLQKNV